MAHLKIANIKILQYEFTGRSKLSHSGRPSLSFTGRSTELFKTFGFEQIEKKEMKDLATRGSKFSLLKNESMVCKQIFGANYMQLRWRNGTQTPMFNLTKGLVADLWNSLAHKCATTVQTIHDTYWSDWISGLMEEHQPMMFCLPTCLNCQFHSLDCKRWRGTNRKRKSGGKCQGKWEEQRLIRYQGREGSVWHVSNVRRSLAISAYMACLTTWPLVSSYL